MRSFTDTAGRTWTVALPVSTLKRVRALVGVDLPSVLDGRLLDQLLRDPVLLCDVVYAVCKPEADARGVSHEDFLGAMYGDVIGAAMDALLEELADFFPSPRDRANIRRVVELSRAVMERARDLMEERLAHLEPTTLLAGVTLAGESGAASTSAPESPASIPAG